jgi:hypothetical protein
MMNLMNKLGPGLQKSMLGVTPRKKSIRSRKNSGLKYSDLTRGAQTHRNRKSVFFEDKTPANQKGTLKVGNTMRRGSRFIFPDQDALKNLTVSTKSAKGRLSVSSHRSNKSKRTR